MTAKELASIAGQLISVFGYWQHRAFNASINVFPDFGAVSWFCPFTLDVSVRSDFKLGSAHGRPVWFKSSAVRIAPILLSVSLASGWLLLD